ncbi:hypothetical protein Vadar_000687 [Vaccinium darrowii]|uniref:Uncharacterized protein n=1 Tax=Vaccinium darrowii TaxID=229202 RepID=A0ACB7Z0T5_9ERIC|nr:hypothetical protein Vadar_000687 [Vaccinium darrowii]
MSIDQIYIPLNSGGHWICIKVDMGKQMTYLFDSMPCSPSNCRRLNLASVVHHTDMYDCGLFVIKFMQGVDYPPGVHLMDDNERPRLLMDLVHDVNNRAKSFVLNQFDEWKGT